MGERGEEGQGAQSRRLPIAMDYEKAMRHPNQA